MTGPGTLPNSETQHDENNQNRHRKTARAFGEGRGLAAPRKGLGVSPAAPPRNRGWPVFGWAWRPGAEVVQEAPAAPRAQVPARPATGAQPPSQGLSRGRRTRLLDGGLTASHTPGRRPWGAGLRDGGHDGGTAARPRGAAATPRPPCDARGINRRRRPDAATQATRTATDGPGRPGRHPDDGGPGAHPWHARGTQHRQPGSADGGPGRALPYRPHSPTGRPTDKHPHQGEHGPCPTTPTGHTGQDRHARLTGPTPNPTTPQPGSPRLSRPPATSPPHTKRRPEQGAAPHSGAPDSGRGGPRTAGTAARTGARGRDTAGARTAARQPTRTKLDATREASSQPPGRQGRRHRTGPGPGGHRQAARRPRAARPGRRRAEHRRHRAGPRRAAPGHRGPLGDEYSNRAPERAGRKPAKPPAKTSAKTPPKTTRRKSRNPPENPPTPHPRHPRPQSYGMPTANTHSNQQQPRPGTGVAADRLPQPTPPTPKSASNHQQVTPGGPSPGRAWRAAPVPPTTDRPGRRPARPPARAWSGRAAPARPSP